MKKRRTLIIALLLVAALALGIGYAALSNVTLNINGSAIVTPDQNNFGVRFDGTPVTNGATAAVLADKTKASMDVTGLTDKGQTATATFTILNDDTVSQYAASIQDVAIAEYDETYFTISTDFVNTVLQPGESMTVTVTVTLIKVPTTAQQATIGISFTAVPQEAAAN